MIRNLLLHYPKATFLPRLGAQFYQEPLKYFLSLYHTLKIWDGAIGKIFD